MAILLSLGIMFTAHGQKPSPELLDPQNHYLVLIDLEGQMAFATKSIPLDQLRSNTAIVTRSSKIFNIPTVITTVAETSFSGPVFPELEELSHSKIWRSVWQGNAGALEIRSLTI